MVADPTPLVPSSPSPFERHGLGWVFRPPYAPVTVTFDRITERRDEVSAEIHVTLRSGGHLARRRLNLMGSRSLSDMARDLDDAKPDTNWPWRRILAEGCESALEAYRAGSPAVVVEGAITPPSPISWQCHELVMDGVPNAWIAAGSTGKSTLLKAYCLHHALGIPFLGRAMQRGVPLYLDYEDTEENFRRTVAQVAKGAGIDRFPKMLWKRGGGPIRSQLHELADLITTHGITCIGVDAVAAAGGEMGDRSYDALAMDIEQSVIALPPVTFILLDHVTGDELKAQSIPRKARGGSRKYEFVRYQWTLVADYEEAQRGRHVVGWTHTKTNATRYLPPFAISITHQDDMITFGSVAAVEVRPVAERMSVVERCIAELGAAQRPLSLTELAELVHGDASRTKRESIRIALQRDRGRNVIQTADGRWTVTGGLNNVVPMVDFASDDDLPFG